MFFFQGPSVGFVCGACHLKLEQAHRVYRSISTPKAKRKALTPSKTPRSVKRIRPTTSTPRQINHSPIRPSSAFSSKRHISFSSHVRSPHTPRSSPKKRKKSGDAKAITSAITNAKYLAAFKHMLARGKSANLAFQKLIRQLVKKEFRTYLRETKSYPKLQGMRSVENFDWSALVNDLSAELPIWFNALSGAMPSLKPNASHHKQQVILPRMGFVMTIPLYTYNPREFKIVQALTGVQMWRCGASEKLFRSFNHLGICQGTAATKRNVDTFCAESDSDLIEWTRQIEANYRDLSPDLEAGNGSLSATATGEPTQAHSLDSQPTNIPVAADAEASIVCPLDLVSSPDDAWIDASDDDDDESDEEYLPLMDETLNDDHVAAAPADSSSDSMPSKDGSSVPGNDSLPKARGFALCWDNTQQLVQSRDQSRNTGNKMHLWANAYAAQNRVDRSDLEELELVLQAKDIPLASYLPSNDDSHMLRQRMIHIASRILVKHIPHFQQFYADAVMWHIPHQYSAESSQRSNIINIGIIDENPSTREGTIAIMSNLQRYVPRRPDGTFRVIPAHGDGLSVERMTDSKRARAADLTDVNRLEGLEQTAQEFHHRGVILQQMINFLYNGNSLAERGTLSQLKNAFEHRNMSKDVMNSFNYVDNFIRFTTEAHIVYLALLVCDMDDIQSAPKHSVPRGTRDDRRNFLLGVCDKIVSEIWSSTPQHEIAKVVNAEADAHDVCFCGQDDIDDQTVRCSNQECNLGTVFHISCVEIAPNHIPDDADHWYCSVECEETSSSPFCKCKSVRPGPVIHCVLGDECDNGRVFHLGCVELAAIPNHDWYCSWSCAEKGGVQQDYLRNYSVAVTWYGMLDLCHRDAIREGDGLAMMSIWKIHMPMFWRGNNYKYLIIAHRLLAGISGWLPPRLIEEIIHNRTVNLKGGKGKNNAMDRVCEFLNAEFKETLKHAHGSLTDATVQRAGKIVGALGVALDSVFEQNIAESTTRDSYRKKKNYQIDIEFFVQEYKEARLFDTIPGRQHPSFPGFKLDRTIPNPHKLKARLMKYSKKLDRTRNVLE